MLFTTSRSTARLVHIVPKFYQQSIQKKCFTSSIVRRSYALFDVEEEEAHHRTADLRVLAKMTTPGLMFVTSRIIDPSKTSDEKYNRFYNEEHLPQILEIAKQHGDITKFALRYKNVNQESAMPYIGLYPLTDASFMKSPDQGKLVADTRKSKVFDGGDIYDFLEFHLRPYERIQVYEGYGHEDDTGEDRGQTLVCVAMEPKAGEDHDFDDWYRKQHLDMLAMCRGYRRTTRYKRQDDKKPRYLALHEWACEPDGLPAEQTKQVTSTEWSKKILGECEVFQRDVFKLIQAQGDVSEKL